MLGALQGALLAVIGIIALSPLLLERVSVFTAESGPTEVVMQMSPTFLTVVAVVASAIFGALTAFFARTAVPALRPGLEFRGRPASALFLGTVIGGVLGSLAAVVGVSVIGQQSEVGVLVPFFPALFLLTVFGAAFGAGTAVAVYAFSEPALEGDEAAEIQAVRRRLLGAVGMPVVAMLAMAVLVLGLAFLFLRFHGMAPLLGMVVAAGVLGSAALLVSRPRPRIPVTEILAAAAGVAILVAFIVVAASLAEEEPAEGEGTDVTAVEGEEAPAEDQPSDTSTTTSAPESDS